MAPEVPGSTANCGDDKLVELPGFLNQARAGLWPVRAWFLKIDPVRNVCMRACVCVRA